MGSANTPCAPAHLRPEFHMLSLESESRKHGGRGVRIHATATGLGVQGAGVYRRSCGGRDLPLLQKGAVALLKSTLQLGPQIHPWAAHIGMACLPPKFVMLEQLLCLLLRN